MKKLSIILFLTIISFGFVGIVNAAETSLNTIASITKEIGGIEKEITPKNTNNAYNYYYKYQVISSNEDFVKYLNQRNIMSNSSDNSAEYAAAAVQVAQYENEWRKLIPEVKTPADLLSNGWVSVTNRDINLSGLNYTQGSHYGYVLAVAATKTGDNTVYITRDVYESTSATTMLRLNGTTTSQSTETPTPSTPEQPTPSTSAEPEKTEVTTKENPETALNDYALYIVPVALITGSYLILKRKSYA